MVTLFSNVCDVPTMLVPLTLTLGVAPYTDPRASGNSKVIHPKRLGYEGGTAKGAMVVWVAALAAV